MARTTIAIASLFLVAGLIVALLPAQESVRGRSSNAAPGMIKPHQPRPLSPSARSGAYPILPAGGEAGTSTLLADGVGPITAEEAQNESAYAPAESADSGDTKS